MKWGLFLAIQITPDCSITTVRGAAMAKKKSQDILELILADHREVENLFSKLEKAKNPEQLYSLFNQLYKAVNLHARAEELVFYPSLREFEDTDDIIEEAEAEHEEAAAMLEEMKALNPDSEEFPERIAELKEALMHHLHEEESEVFEIIRESMDEQELSELGQEFQQAKTKLEAEINEAASR